MADWAVPVLTSRYDTVVLPALKERDTDALTLGYTAYTNPPTGAMKYVRASNKFQEYNGATWDDKLLAIAGGGTGAATAANARTNLGIGTMGIQNSNAVNITGGSISGVHLSGTNIDTGTVAVARGGTGITSYTTGDIIYASAATTLSRLAKGTAGYFLRVNLAGTTLEYAAVTPAALGLVIGVNVQAYNAHLTTIDQDLTTTSNVRFNTIHSTQEIHGETTLLIKDQIDIGLTFPAATHYYTLYDGATLRGYISNGTGVDDLGLKVYSAPTYYTRVYSNDALALGFGVASFATFSGSLSVPATYKVVLNGPTNDTYIHEQADNVMEFMVGGTALFRLTNTILQVYASGTWREVTFKTVTDMLGDPTAHALCVHY